MYAYLNTQGVGVPQNPFPWDALSINQEGPLSASRVNDIHNAILNAQMPYHDWTEIIVGEWGINDGQYTDQGATNTYNYLRGAGAFGYSTMYFFQHPNSNDNPPYGAITWAPQPPTFVVQSHKPWYAKLQSLFQSQ
jgi:hypothetical protein